MSRRSNALLVAAAASALAVPAFAQVSPTFKVSIGVRETNALLSTTIGANGGVGDSTAGGAGNSIEYVNRDGLDLIGDGTWQNFTINFGTDPVNLFAGLQPPGGAANRLDGALGIFEQIRFRNFSGTTDPIALYIDDIYNTPVGGSPVLIEDFDSYPAVTTPTNGAPEVLFRDPRFSGSNQGILTTTDTGNVSADSAVSGANSYRLGFQFLNGTTTNQLRFTTFNTANRPNPVIDIQPGSTFSFKLRAVVTPTPQGWNVDADGNWSTDTNWLGAVPAGTSAIARFGGAIQITAPRTVTNDVARDLNTMIFSSTQSYTIAGPETITFKNPIGFNGLIQVSSGNHFITAPLVSNVVGTTGESMVVDTSTGASLTSGAIAAFDAEVDDLKKRGGGTWITTHVRNDALSVEGGTLQIASDGTDAGTSEVNSISFAGGATPTAKLDLTNNKLIVDWDPNAFVPRPNAIFSVRARIVNGFNGGDWLGNGITSSTAAANGAYALGYADAATLGVSIFGGRGVDLEATLVRYTLKGDHDLDGDVDFDDLLNLAQNYDPAYDPTGVDGPRFWTRGDYNYDGIINFDDLLALAQNYGGNALTSSQIDGLGVVFGDDWRLAMSMVPEPMSLSALAGLALVARRRR